jgi:hypothetical protein
MVAVALVFKSSILSIWFASKLKIISFLKGLTIIQGLSLALKRWIIDNVITEWLKKHIFSHFIRPFKEIKEYYSVISWKVKFKNLLFFLLPLSLAGWAMYATDVLTHFALYAELKVLVNSFFKAIWVLFGKFFSFFGVITSWIAGSWLAPILEVFALSYLLTLIERILGEGNPLSRFFAWIGNILNNILAYIGLLNNRHIDPIVEKSVVRGAKSASNSLSNIIKNKKISEELLYFDNFKNIIMQGHIDAYHYFKGMHQIRDKKELYKRINERTKDNIDIVAYISRNKKGELLDSHTADSFYHDIFILEGIASNPYHGVKEDLAEGIDHTDFWVLNTSKYPVQLNTKSKNFTPRYLEGNSITLIKTKRYIDYHDRDIFCEYLGTQRSPTPIY